MSQQGREVQEAIQCGETALQALQNAARKMDKASRWGYVDILGGDLFSGIAKHSSISQAADELEDAKIYLKQFYRELQDLEHSPDISIDHSAFLNAADFLLDEPVMDILVQSKIHRTRQQISETMQAVEEILSQLKTHETEK